MKLKVIVPVLLIGIAVLALVLFVPGVLPVRASSGDSFDPVWAIMDRDRSESGCRGCHVRKEPGFSFWFGNDKETVRQTLETGINPDGEDLAYSPVEGGRAGWLAWYLHEGIMPLGGKAWNEDQLALLDAWLITYEPPDLFEPVWQIMNQAPREGGCVGCHLRQQAAGFGPWFGPDKETVLNTLETGITPDGRTLFRIPVAGGSKGRLASYLRSGFMPRGGRRWVQEELDLLYEWLAIYKK